MRLSRLIFAFTIAWVFSQEPNLLADQWNFHDGSDATDSQDSRLPSVYIEFTTVDGKTKLSFMITAVPKPQEKKFLHDITESTRRSGSKSDPLYIIDDDVGDVAPDLPKRLGLESKVKVIKIPDLHRDPRMAYDPTCHPSRGIASDDGSDTSGYLVTAASTGLASWGWYYTAGPVVGATATAATVIDQTINNVFSKKIGDAMSSGGAVGAAAAAKVAPDSGFLTGAGDLGGQSSVAYVKNLIETQAFKSIQNGTVSQFKNAFTTWAGAGDLVKTAGAGLIANNAWEYAFNRWRTDHSVSESTIKKFTYMKSIFLAALAPFGLGIFGPHLKLIAQATMLVFGLIGMYAAFYGPQTVNLVKHLLEKLEATSAFKMVDGKLKQAFDFITKVPEDSVGGSKPPANAPEPDATR